MPDFKLPPPSKSSTDSGIIYCTETSLEGGLVEPARDDPRNMSMITFDIEFEQGVMMLSDK